MLVEILPHIWIGSLNSLNNNIFFTDKSIRCVINLEKDMKFMEGEVSYTPIVQKNILKYNIIKMSEYLNKATLYLYNNIKKSQSVLIVCKKGNLKSPVLILAYLIRYSSLDKEVAKKIIKTKITDSFLNGIYGELALNNFIESLKK